MIVVSILRPQSDHNFFFYNLVLDDDDNETLTNITEESTPPLVALALSRLLAVPMITSCVRSALAARGPLVAAIATVGVQREQLNY